MAFSPALAAVAAGSVLAFATEAEVRTNRIALADIADLKALPADLRERAAGLTLATLPADRRRVVLDGAWLAARARAQLPALSAWLPRQPGDVVILRGRTGAAVPLATGAMPASITRGETVSVRISSGPVAVTRAATALQDASSGGKLFVATQDRAVIAAQCCGGR